VGFTFLPLASLSHCCNHGVEKQILREGFDLLLLDRIRWVAGSDMCTLWIESVLTGSDKMEAGSDMDLAGSNMHIGGGSNMRTYLFIYFFNFFCFICCL